MAWKYFNVNTFNKGTIPARLFEVERVEHVESSTSDKLVVWLPMKFRQGKTLHPAVSVCQYFSIMCSK